MPDTLGPSTDGDALNGPLKRAWAPWMRVPTRQLASLPRPGVARRDSRSRWSQTATSLRRGFWRPRLLLLRKAALEYSSSDAPRASLPHWLRHYHE